MSIKQYEYVKSDNQLSINAFITGIEKIRPHWHSELELIFIKKGEVILNYGDKSYNLKQNDIALINTDSIHSLSAYNDNLSENMMYVIHINKSIFKHYDIDLNSIRFVCNSADVTKGEHKEFNIIRNLVLKIFAELEYKQMAYIIAVNSLLSEIVTLLVRNFSEKYDSNEDSDKDNIKLKLERVFNYINENYSQDISIKTLAESEYISSYYLSHLFKDFTGISFTDYLYNIRVERSLNDLKNTSKSITTILYEVGFNNHKSFGKAFKKVMGCTPTEYRKNSNSSQTRNAVSKKEADPLYNRRSSVGEYIQQEHVEFDFSFDITRHNYNSSSFIEENEQVIETISISDGHKNLWKIKKIWKLTTFGRAYEGLRADVQRQIRDAQKDLKFEYVRFHGLLFDEMAVLLTDKNGGYRYNFTYVDELFDFLLSVNLKPFVEFGLMPTALAKGNKTIFWWEGNISMPKDMKTWRELIEKLMLHWIERYGFKEVKSWYFEVWNEPNLKDYFFDGDINDYIELYKNTVEVIKAIESEFKVGGPATSNFKNGKAPWVEDFLTLCANEKLPIDFISTHPYPNNFPLDEMKNQLECYRHEDSLKEDLTWLNETIAMSEYKDCEIHLTEWNSSPNSRDLVHDIAFMAPFIIKNNLDNMYNTDMLGYWTITDIFEEKSPEEYMFHGGFGLVNKLGIKKPSYYGYMFLSKLGDEVVKKTDDYIITKDRTGYQILVYNYVHYKDDFANGIRDNLKYYDRYSVFRKGDKKRYAFEFDFLTDTECTIITTEVNSKNGCAYEKWKKVGAPEYPTNEELKLIKGMSVPKKNMIICKRGEEKRIKTAVEEHGVFFAQILIKD